MRGGGRIVESPHVVMSAAARSGARTMGRVAMTIQGLQVSLQSAPGLGSPLPRFRPNRARHLLCRHAEGGEKPYAVLGLSLILALAAPAFVLEDAAGTLASFCMARVLADAARVWLGAARRALH